jgi:hypothetical protein
MSNIAHVNASFYLRIETELTEEEYFNKFDKETIVASKVELTLPDGSVHKVSLADILTFDTEEFEENEKPLDITTSDQIGTAPTTMLS